MVLKVGIRFFGEGAKKLVSEALEVQKVLAAVNKSDPSPVSDGYVALARALGVTYSEVKKLTAGIGLSNDQVRQAVSRIQELRSVNVSAAQQYTTLNKELGITQEQFKRLSGIVQSTSQQTKQATSIQDQFGGGVAGLAFKFNSVVQAAQTLIATLRPAYDSFIGSNEKLNAQLLQSQTNLASTSRVFKDGIEIKDPTEAIKASEGQLRSALKQIERDTQSLVGVTSQQVNELFQITLTNAKDLNNQSKQFPDPISAATSLTKGWASALGTLNIPLDQARQEINSVIKGQIDNNSVLAKNLGLTNEQVNKYKAQGTLVDELNKRFEPFVAGNALAARSVAGVSSNVQDLIERITRVAGEPLLGPIVDGLSQLEQFLKANEEQIQEFSNEAISQLLDLVKAVVDSAQAIAVSLLPAFQALGPAAIEGGRLIVTGLTAAAQAAGVVGQTIAPVVNLLAQVAAKSVEIITTAQSGIGLLTGGFGRSTEAVEALGGATATLTNEATARYGDLKKALDARNAAQKQGIELTKEQKQQEQGAIANSKKTIEALKAQKKELEATKGITIGAENRGNLDSQINEVDRAIAAQEKLQGSFTTTAPKISFQAKELSDLGSTYKQLNTKAEQALKTLSEGGGGDEQKLKAAAKEVIDLTQQQLEAGLITQAEAEKRLNQVRTNSKVEFDLQSKASDSITKIRETESKRRIEAVKTEQQDIQADLAAGTVSAALAEKKTTEAKIKEINIRLEANRTALAREKSEGRGNGQRAKELVQEEKQIQAELSKTRADGRKAQNQERIRDFDEQTKGLEAEFAERTITEEQFNERSLAITEARGAEELQQLAAQRKLLAATDKEGLEAIAAQEAEVRARVAKAREDALRKDIERRTRLIEEESAKAADAIQAAETERLTQIQQLQNAGGDPQEIERQKLQATRDRINAELQAEQQKLEQLRALPQPTDPKEVAARENTIRDQIQKTAQLRLQQLQNEGQQQEALRALAIRRIEDQATAQKRASDRAIQGIEQQKLAVERQKAALDTVTQSLDRQTKLLEAQNKLQDAQAGLAGAVANAELTSVQKAIELRQRLNQETDPQKRKAIEQALATLGVNRNAKELDLVKQRQAIEDKIAKQQQAAQQAEFLRQQANLQVELQRNEIAARRALLEAQIAEQQAKQNQISQQQAVRDAEAAIAKAQQTTDTRDDVAAQAQLEGAKAGAIAADQSVELATTNRQEAEKQLADQATLAEKAKESLNLQQQAQLVQSQSAETIRGITQSLELADAKAASIANNLANAAGSAQAIGGGLSGGGAMAIAARRMGGPVEAGQPYLVGEEGPEIVVPKIAGTVLTAKQTAALLSPMAIAPAMPAVTVNPTASIGQLKQATAVLQRIEKSLATRPTEGMQINFNNDPDPDLSIYKVMRSLNRVGR